MHELKNKTVFALDMDGTLYLGNQLFPYTQEFLAGIQSAGKDFILLTNNSSKSPNDYLGKLAGMGIEMPPEKIYTSGTATIDYFLKNNLSRKIYLMGTPALCQQFIEAGFEIDAPQPDFVVLGFDLNFTFGKLDKACRLIRSGVPFIATHPDFNCPLEGGDMLPDCGALSAAITAATGVHPKVIGKPNQEMLDGVLHRLQKAKADLVLVGDRLMTDIQMGLNFSILSVLVLSGETKRGHLPNQPVRPDIVVERTVDLLEWV